MTQSDDTLFTADAGDWRDRLMLVVETVRDLSRQGDPQAMIGSYAERMKKLIPVDRTITLSRRDVQPPAYRITRSDLWAGDITSTDPWKDADKLPVLTGGLLGLLLYGDQPRLLDDFTSLLKPDDPALEHFAGMKSLIAIPHYDMGVGTNMVVHLRKEPAAFSRTHFAEFVLMSNLFGRATHNLVLAGQLRAAELAMKEQYAGLAQLSDTVIQQAVGLKHYSEELEKRVTERTAELREAHLEAIYMLAVACEAKDEDTGRHVRRIRDLSASVARELGMSQKEADALGHAAVLHDVGKLHVPDQILKKPGPLAPLERLKMQEHTVAGERILADSPFFAAARRIARSHHENYDGSGYPDNLAGQHIPIEARVVHLADVFDALSNPRVYKAAWSVNDAIAVIRESSGKMFDPEVLKAFSSLFDRGALADPRRQGA